MNPLMESLEKMLGQERLAKLAQTQVGIAGVGGLGSNTAVHLVRSGFMRLTLVDFDCVEPSNLNRQFYFADQLGRLKVEALAENLLRINPDLELSLSAERLTTENIGEILGDCAIWVEAFDKAEAKKMIVESALRLEKPIVSASGLAGWGNTDALRTKAWRKGLVIIGDQYSAVGDGRPPMSPRVGVAAAKEADTVLTWALGEEGD